MTKEAIIIKSYIDTALTIFKGKTFSNNEEAMLYLEEMLTDVVAFSIKASNTQAHSSL